MTRCGRADTRFRRWRSTASSTSLSRPRPRTSSRPPFQPMPRPPRSAPQAQSSRGPQSRDNIGVVGYDVYHDDHLLRTVDGSTTLTSLTGLAPNTRYRVTIRARDAAGGTSAASNAVQFTTETTGDIKPPEAPGSMRVTGATGSTISLAWQASSDAGAVYDLYVDGTKIGSTSLTTATSPGWRPRRSISSPSRRATPPATTRPRAGPSAAGPLPLAPNLPRPRLAQRRRRRAARLPRRARPRRARPR